MDSVKSSQKELEPPRPCRRPNVGGADLSFWGCRNAPRRRPKNDRKRTPKRNQKESKTDPKWHPEPPKTHTQNRHRARFGPKLRHAAPKRQSKGIDTKIHNYQVHNAPERPTISTRSRKQHGAKSREHGTKMGHGQWRSKTEDGSADCAERLNKMKKCGKSCWHLHRPGLV